MTTPTIQRWLDSIPNPNTRRQYAAGIAAFIAHAGLASDDALQRATPRQVKAFLNALRDRASSPATVNSRRAAIAAFYRYTETTEDWPANPAARIKANRVSPYGHARYPSASQVKALLAAIPTDTTVGLRNLAIILGMYATTRRINEWISLRWSDIQHGPNGQWFTYTAKGGADDRQAIPAELWSVIEDYLLGDGRYPLAGDAYLFTPAADPGRPISAGYVRGVLQRYGAIAGLPAQLCHPHGLRHAGARARKAAGQSPWDLQHTLNHKNIRTTMIYTNTVLDEPADPVGDAVIANVLPNRPRQSR